VKLHTKILLGLVLGAAVGITANVVAGGQVGEAGRLLDAGVRGDSLRAAVPATAVAVERLNTYVMGPVGQIFLRMLFMVVVPLVVATLTLGVANLGDLKSIGSLGGKTIVYFLATTIVAATVGLIFVNTIHPGSGLSPEVRTQLMTTFSTEAGRTVAAAHETSFGINTFVAIVPRNPVKAAADLDMLGLIFFSLIFGVALTMIPAAKAEPVKQFLDGLAEAVIRIIDMAMRLAPYGVFGLIFVTTSRFGLVLLKPLGLYVVTVVGALLFHALVNLGVILRVFAGINPFRFFRRAEAAIITAFSTSSSAATLPTALRVAEQELQVPPSVAGFVLPLGATMNMNGTALFEGVTVLFLAQVFGAGLSVPVQAIVIVLSVLMAVGAAGVPGGSIPLMVLVLQTVGVPGEYIALIIGVDRILDMCRTTVNVTGDLSATCVVARWSGLWDPRRLDAPPTG